MKLFVFYNLSFWIFLGAFFSFWAFKNFSRRYQTIVMLTFSMYFFYEASGFLVFIAICSAAFNYLIAKVIHQSEGWRKMCFIGGIACNLTLLLLFKSAHLLHLTLLLPIGISFYTFENISYLSDVYSKKVEPAHTIGEYMAFVFFFPKLIMGPIVRAKDFFRQFNQPQFATQQQIGRGLYLIVSGLVKKVYIADYLNATIVQPIFDTNFQHTGIEYLTAVYAYAFVIYCDFSGYSSIAIGISSWMGIELPENFNSPYQAITPSDFWRRWHISLSSWFRDYLFIPLGGSLGNNKRILFNLLITMTLCGIWHGISWNFLVWGVYHGLLLVVWGKASCKVKWQQFLQCILLFHLVCVGWILFRTDSLTAAWQFGGNIFKHWDYQALMAFLVAYKQPLSVLGAALFIHYLPLSFKAAIKTFTSQLSLVVLACLLFITLWAISHVQIAQPLTPIYLKF